MISLYRRDNAISNMLDEFRASLPEWATAGSNHQTDPSYQTMLLRDIRARVILESSSPLWGGVNYPWELTNLFIDVMRKHGDSMPYAFRDAYARAHEQAQLNFKSASVPYWRTIWSLVFGTYMEDASDSYKAMMKRVFLYEV